MLMESNRKYPKIGSAAVVQNDMGSLLLGRRGKHPNYGKWVMPGGKIEWGETIDEAVVREVLEETGLVVKVVERLGVFEIVNDEEHTLFVLSRCEPTMYGRLKAGDDLEDVGWWRHPEEAPLSDPCRAALTQIGLIGRNRKRTMTALSEATKGPAFSNGTEGSAWMDKWCGYCDRDHEMHGDNPSGGCSIILAHMIDHNDWPEAWLPEPDDGQFYLPSRMVCLAFKPCQQGTCTGDPGAEDRAERVAEVTAYWQGRTREE